MDAKQSTKLCECGCGQSTRIADKNNRSRGWIKGRPLRFVTGHNSKSNNPAFKHGHAKRKQKTAVYDAWAQMIARCTNPKMQNWKYYGGRGIKVCDQWLESFEKFLADMGLPTKERYVLGRIDNDGNYQPGNVRWETRLEQGSNKRNSVLLTFRGKTQHKAAWARELGLKRTVLEGRISRGWPIEKAFTTPSSDGHHSRAKDARLFRDLG